MNPLDLFLEPPGPLLTHLRTVNMACSERLPTRLNPLAERTCFSQVQCFTRTRCGRAGCFCSPRSVRAVPGRLSAIRVFLCKSVLYGAFVWARRALNSRKRRFPARAVDASNTMTRTISPPINVGVGVHHLEIIGFVWHGARPAIPCGQ